MVEIAGLGSFTFGSSLGWSSPAIDRMLSTSDLGEDRTKYLVEWIISLVPLGSAIGICVWTYFNDRYGPRKTMLIQSPFTLLSWILLAIEPKRRFNLYMFVRFCCGFFGVSYVISGESLLVESIHRANVPKFIIGHRSCVLGGVLFSYTINGFIKGKVANVEVGITNPLMIVIHMIMLWCCPESPVYLYSKNEQKAIKSLIWYKGEQNLGEELRIIKKDAEMKNVDPDAHKYMFLASVVKKALLIVLGLFFCQVFSGYYAFMFEYSRIWHDYNDYCVSQEFDPIIYGAVMLTSNTLSSIIHYRHSYGVRKPLILSCTIIFLSNISALVYVTLYLFEILDNTDVPKYFPLISTCVYALGYEVGLCMCPDILLADYMPHQIYLRARMICKTFSWFLVFVYIHLFTFINQKIKGGMAYNIGLMSCTSFLTLIFVLVFVIETQNKTLIQIQIELGGNPIGNRGGSRQRSLGVDRRLLTASV